MGIFRVTADILTARRTAATVIVVPEPDTWRDFLRYFGFDDAPGTVDGFRLYLHDWLITPLRTWRDELDQRALTGAEPGPRVGPPPVVLGREAFDDAVRAALATVSEPHRLAGSPLLHSRLLPPDRDEPIEALHRLLLSAVDDLRHIDRRVHAQRAVRAAFLEGIVTREVAASRAGMSESTFKRHLRTGVAAVCEALWQLELDGTC